MDVLPGGEIAFSIVTGIWSETLGQLPDGDVLSDRGRILHTNAQLLTPFSPMPIVPDVGLDALQILDSGEIYFSIKTNSFSEALGLTLRRGDLLSSAGRIMKTQEQLLARFQPALTNVDYGLDAVYLWPSGEIWFSTETGFTDNFLGEISGGDLLSDRVMWFIATWSCFQRLRRWKI